MAFTRQQCIELNKLLPEISDSIWQLYLAEIREEVTPSEDSKMPIRQYSFENTLYTYYGETEYYRYCQFINGILRTIRSGAYDFCFKVEHIVDLLRFEHDRLCAEWIPEDACFRVSINR